MAARNSNAKHLSSEFLPPQRKGLAGLKRPYSDVIMAAQLSSASSSDIGARVNNLMVSVLNKNISDMEAIEIARSASMAAERAAEKSRVAKAVFQEKAATAVKAKASAQWALEAVAASSEADVPVQNSLPAN